MVILILLLAITIIIYIIRQIFRFAHPYAHPMLPVSRGDGGGQRGGGTGAAILIGGMLLCLAYVSIESQQGEPPVREEPPVENPLPEPPVESPPVDTSPDQPAPVSVHDVEIFLDQREDGWEIDRYNQQPEAALPPIYYAIQIEAFAEAEYARRNAERLSATTADLRLIYLPGPVPFKLIIGPFTTRAAAVSYQQSERTGGFIRLIDRYEN